jgi:glutamate formiminotransferase/formiminotetrahydrofolate cyclodeaminase
MGAFLNVKINAAGLKDRDFAADILAKGVEMEKKAIQMESEIMAIVNLKITSSS